MTYSEVTTMFSFSFTRDMPGEPADGVNEVISSPCFRLPSVSPQHGKLQGVARKYIGDNDAIRIALLILNEAKCSASDVDEVHDLTDFLPGLRGVSSRVQSTNEVNWSQPGNKRGTNLSCYHAGFTSNRMGIRGE